MRYAIFILLGCLIVGSLASPIISQSKELKSEPLESGRQSESSQNQVDNEDDDDDDDDDDVIDIETEDDDDDDDDDDEEEEQPAGGAAAAADEDDEDDDDEGDYFERFFDDILGDDDDDDDEDEETSPSTSQQVVLSPASQPETPVEPQPSEQSAGEIAYDEDNNVVATIENTANPESEKEQASTTPVGSPTTPNVVVQPVAAQESEEEDDDDDDDLDIGEVEEEDDDDDDEEEDDDDDDDDEEDDIEDVIDGRTARASEPASPRVPPTFITKYNRYVDNVLERINKVLRTGYDPVNVRLHSVKNNSNNKNTKKKNSDKKKKKNKNKKREERAHIIQGPGSEVNVTISNVTVESITSTTTPSSTPILTKIDSRAKENKKKTSNKNKTSDKPRAKATLYGMASLKRSDDVTVNLMSSHTTIKSKFSVGPLTLKVEKEFGRGAKKELRSATATTTEMIGRISLRLENGGRATLHSIRVMQPNLLRVDTPDDHDKTREFVWRRSSHIAQIVSQKLTKAARSLMPPREEPVVIESTTLKPKKKKPTEAGLLSYLF